jgi:hypothetical protein
MSYAQVRLIGDVASPEQTVGNIAAHVLDQ